MLLIQLSDLHIGSNYFRQEIFDTIVYEVKNKLKPDDASQTMVREYVHMMDS